MRLKLDIDPDLVAMMEAEIKAGEKAILAVAGLLPDALRMQIAKARNSLSKI
ncbi:hypothetical protein [Paracoccus sp. (in: a-proteobacteria)]|uniref:hypothetical protein n=1 Tax=Paracoccus sp. TaxID=267 RepID=UPI0035B2D676